MNICPRSLVERLLEEHNYDVDETVDVLMEDVCAEYSEFSVWSFVVDIAAEITPDKEDESGFTGSWPLLDIILTK